MTASTYEFTPEQNVLLGHLASRMKIVGRVLMTLAILAVTFVTTIGRFGGIPAAW